MYLRYDVEDSSILPVDVTTMELWNTKVNADLLAGEIW
jgi:hypothetical protein